MSFFVVQLLINTKTFQSLNAEPCDLSDYDTETTTPDESLEQTESPPSSSTTQPTIGGVNQVVTDVGEVVTDVGDVVTDAVEVVTDVVEVVTDVGGLVKDGVNGLIGIL